MARAIFGRLLDRLPLSNFDQRLSPSSFMERNLSGQILRFWSAVAFTEYWHYCVSVHIVQQLGSI